MASPPPRIRRLALDFHRTLADWADITYTTQDVLGFPEFFKARSYKDPDWLQGFLANVRRSGISLFIVSKQEDRFDGLPIEKIRAIQREEKDLQRRLTSEEIAARYVRQPEKYMGGRRLISATLDLLFDGDRELRSSMLPDAHIVLYDDLPLPRPFDKVAQMDYIHALPAGGSPGGGSKLQTMLIDDSYEEINAVQSAGYLAGRVDATKTLSQEFWVLQARIREYGYPGFEQLHRQVQEDVDYDLSLGVDPPSMQMLSIANQLSIIALAGVEALAKLSAAAADQLGDPRASIRRPIQAILDSYYQLHTSQRAQYKDTREVFAEALNAYMEAAARQSFDRSSPGSFLEAEVAALTEYANRHSANARGLRHAIKKMEKTRVKFIKAVRRAQALMSYDEVAHDPKVLHTRSKFFRETEEVGRWL